MGQIGEMGRKGKKESSVGRAFQPAFQVHHAFLRRNTPLYNTIHSAGWKRLSHKSGHGGFFVHLHKNDIRNAANCQDQSGRVLPCSIGSKRLEYGSQRAVRSVGAALAPPFISAFGETAPAGERSVTSEEGGASTATTMPDTDLRDSR